MTASSDNLGRIGSAPWYQRCVPEAIDPLLLGQRVVAILETGVRVATYKLATLMALIDHCIENLPEHPADQLAVPVPDLAHRVLQLYWRQVRPFEGHDLRQSSGEKERIPRAVRALRAATPASSLSVAMTLAPEVHQTSIDEIGGCAWRSSRCIGYSGCPAERPMIRSCTTTASCTPTCPDGRCGRTVTPSC